ncbi:hypothetical protein BRADI_5g03875v3 [Brachypodium distachyon]|uniref:Uncharacterized protein n=1 Tax=Brachypodium distachyon TaxID=15368 RepID=A0A2K2CFE3_BRADI|nr:hypothetical protein BRADI_5g03875v3 [Brachypodium distachyon]
MNQGVDYAAACPTKRSATAPAHANAPLAFPVPLRQATYHVLPWVSSYDAPATARKQPARIRKQQHLILNFCNLPCFWLYFTWPFFIYGSEHLVFILIRC